MKIENEFKVGLPIDRTWAVLTDLEGVASCLPGAQLTGSEGDTYMGKVKIKVGPVTSEYAGTATFEEKDEAAYHAVISTKGRDARGAGSVSAMITAQLRSEGDQTVVSLDTDLKITGKVAQFGNSMIVEVSEKLLAQFVANLEEKLALQQSPGFAAEPGRSETPSEVPSNEAIDLMQLARGSMAKRLVPAAIIVVVVAIVIYLLAR